MPVYSIIGGMSLLWGPLVGAVILVPFSIVLRGLTPIQGGDIIIYAILLAVLALVLPQGIAGWFIARQQQSVPASGCSHFREGSGRGTDARRHRRSARTGSLSGSGAGMSTLRVENVSAGYGKANVIRAVSLEIAAGQRVALVGSNGAGKSTIERAINGLLPLRSGRVEWDGTSIGAMPASHR